MTTELFATLDEVLQPNDPTSGLSFLADRFLASKEYGLVFEARLMLKRYEMGLSLIQTDGITDERYQLAVMDAARETGRLFLADGKIDRAWPYFRAVSELQPVQDALDKVEPGDNVEALIAIAFQEGVHPLKGLELILAKHGMCRAITAFGMTAVTKDRERCIALLATSLHGEIMSRMTGAVEAQEGSRPAATSLPELMRGRDWLFGEWDYYVDTSHLLSVIPYCVEVTDGAVLRVFSELCEYGQHLSPQFQSPGVPPFANQCLAYWHYTEALRGDSVDEHVGYFRDQLVESDPEVAGDAPGRALVRLLVSLKRAAEALDVLLESVVEDDPYGAPVPSALSLCYQAGDFARMKLLARERGDLLSYAAAASLAEQGESSFQAAATKSEAF